MVGQLIVSGQPLLIPGGELGNSSAGTAAQADIIVPKLAVRRVNTILMSVAWEQIEPKEGNLDFSILLLELANAEDLNWLPQTYDLIYALVRWSLTPRDNSLSIEVSLPTANRSL
jgi:hypothetical protein